MMYDTVPGYACVCRWTTLRSNVRSECMYVKLTDDNTFFIVKPGGAAELECIQTSLSREYIMHWLENFDRFSADAVLYDALTSEALDVHNDLLDA